MKMRLLLAVRSLDIGGAERQFLELARKLDKTRYEVSVVTLRAGVLDHEIGSDPSVAFSCLDKRGRYDIGCAFRYAAVIDAFKPDVVYSFMFDMNVLSALSVWLSRHRPRLAWGIFGSEPDFRRGPRFLRVLFLLLKTLEGRADLVVSDSVRGLEFLRRYGFRLRASQVIFSGTDTHRFQRRVTCRASFRSRFGLAGDDVAVGICSRLVHMKGYPVLALAARQLLSEFPNLWFFAIGYGDERIREDAVRVLGDKSERFVWLGKQEHPEEFFSGWDIYCSSSVYGEGFSNSIIEAMASELPVVATDVGDARIQVGESGLIIEPGDAQALEGALRAMIRNQGRSRLGAAARRRVLENFSADVMARKTGLIMEQLTVGRTACGNGSRAVGLGAVSDPSEEARLP